jgi:hypothetical protein
MFSFYLKNLVNVKILRTCFKMPAGESFFGGRTDPKRPSYVLERG